MSNKIENLTANLNIDHLKQLSQAENDSRLTVNREGEIVVFTGSLERDGRARRCLKMIGNFLSGNREANTEYRDQNRMKKYAADAKFQSAILDKSAGILNSSETLSGPTAGLEKFFKRSLDQFNSPLKPEDGGVLTGGHLKKVRQAMTFSAQFSQTVHKSCEDTFKSYKPGGYNDQSDPIYKQMNDAQVPEGKMAELFGLVQNRVEDQLLKPNGEVMEILENNIDSLQNRKGDSGVLPTDADLNRDFLAPASGDSFDIDFTGFQLELKSSMKTGDCLANLWSKLTGTPEEKCDKMIEVLTRGRFESDDDLNLIIADVENRPGTNPVFNQVLIADVEEFVN